MEWTDPFRNCMIPATKPFVLLTNDKITIILVNVIDRRKGVVIGRITSKIGAC
jgi:hypothetical protein